MKIVLLTLVLLTAAVHNEALKCYTCAAGTEEECNLKGSSSCPQFADACATITGTNAVMKFCSYKAFCDLAQNAKMGLTMDCCFTDDCNGPHHSHSYGQTNSAGALSPGSGFLLLPLASWLAALHL